MAVTNIPKATPFKAAMLINLQLVNWLDKHCLEPLMQGWQRSDGGRPWVLIHYSRGHCEGLKREYDAEIVGRWTNEQGAQLRYQIEIHGCAVQWIEQGV